MLGLVDCDVCLMFEAITDYCGLFEVIWQYQGLLGITKAFDGSWFCVFYCIEYPYNPQVGGFGVVNIFMDVSCIALILDDKYIFYINNI